MRDKKPAHSISSMCMSHVFLLVLTTSQIATIADVPEAYGGELLQDKKLLLKRNDISEKVVINKGGPNLNFTIIGNKGLYCALVYKAPTFMSDYGLFPNTNTIIGQDGTARITLPLADFVDQDVIFKVITSDRSDLSANIKGTREIVVKIINGQIANISSVHEETSPGDTQAVLAASAKRPLMCSKGNVLPGAASRGGQ